MAIHPVGRLAHHVAIEREPMRPAGHDAGHDARLLEHLEVLGDRRLRDAEPGGGLTDGRGTGGETLDDSAADRVREGPERIVHHMVNSITAGGVARVPRRLASPYRPSVRTNSRARPRTSPSSSRTSASPARSSG